MLNFFTKIYLKKIITKYEQLGLEIGDMISYSYMGRPIGIEKKCKKFFKLERRLLSNKYTPVSLNNFASRGGWGRDVNTNVVQGLSRESFRIHQENIELVAQAFVIMDNPDKYYEVVEITKK